MHKKFRGNVCLLLTAIIWGTAFVAQKVGMHHIGPFTVQMMRSYLGALALLPMIFLLDHQKKKKRIYQPATRTQKKMLWIGGACCGICLTVASCLQQFGLQEADPGKAGFFTAMYLLFVPVCGLFFHKKPPKRIWFCIVIAVSGMYLLCCGTGRFTVTASDILLLLCALAFTGHILVIDFFSPKTDGVKMSCIQFFFSGVLSTIPALVLETPTAGAVLSAWIPLCYLGFLSSGVGYTLQIVGQKYTEPALASLLMSFESVFSMVAGALYYRKLPTLPEAIGCVLLFAAILISQFPVHIRKEPIQTESPSV